MGMGLLLGEAGRQTARRAIYWELQVCFLVQVLFDVLACFKPESVHLYVAYVDGPVRVNSVYFVS